MGKIPEKVFKRRNDNTRLTGHPIYRVLPAVSTYYRFPPAIIDLLMVVHFHFQIFLALNRENGAVPGSVLRRLPWGSGLRRKRGSPCVLHAPISPCRHLTVIGMGCQERFSKFGEPEFSFNLKSGHHLARRFGNRNQLKASGQSDRRGQGIADMFGCVDFWQMKMRRHHGRDMRLSRRAAAGYGLFDRAR